MKKLISLFAAAALLFAAISCSDGSSSDSNLIPPGVTSGSGTGTGSGSGTGNGSGSGSGFTGGSDGIRIGNYTLDFDDGNPIAVFAFDTNDTRFESYKMCFYSDKTVKVRVTPVVQISKTKGKRYDYMTGTYEGDPTADGDISISFSKKLDYGYLFLLGTVKYENYEGTVPNTVTISDGKFTFKEKASSWGDKLQKTTKEDLLSYHYSQTNREDVNATEIVIPEGYSKIPVDCFRDNSKLAKVTIPSTVKEIYYAFNYSLKDLEIVYKGTKENWKKIKVCGYEDNYKTAKITCTDGEVKFSSIERDYNTGKSYVKFEDK